MALRWLKRWITHPNPWIDLVILATLGAALIFIAGEALGWW